MKITKQQLKEMIQKEVRKHLKEESHEEVDHPQWEEFKNIVDKHDWYFEYSDDHKVWSKGDEQRRRMTLLAREIGEPAKEYIRKKRPPRR
jgi:hypothetical protein